MKVKKILSLVLSLIMILSVMQASFVAFAADNEAVAAVEDAVFAYDGNLTVAEPEATALEGYDKIVSMFKSLTADEKEAVDVFAFDKLYHKVLDRERQLSIIANPSISKSNKQHYINAGAAIETVLGGIPAYIDEAVALNTVTSNSKNSAQVKLDAFSAASVNARIYADNYYASYQCFYYAIDANPVKTFANIVKAISDADVKAEPFPGTQPKRTTKPNVKNYADGEADPQYIADYAVYWAGEIAYYQFDTDKKNYTADKNVEAMIQVASVAPEYKDMVDFTVLAKEAKAAYDADSANKAQAAKAVEVYETLSEEEKNQISKLSTYVYYGANEGKLATSYTAPKLYTACVDIGNAQYVEAFIDVINSIEEPYTRADIEKAKAAYSLVPSSLTSTIDSELTAKYKAILASIGPDEQNTDKPSTDEYATTSVKYPSGYSKKQVTKAIDNLYKTVLDIIGTDESGVKKSLEEAVFSNALIGTLVKLVYPAIGKLNSLVAYGPNDLANKLTEEKYQLAAEKLRAAATVDENGKIVKDLADWDKVSFESGDFGFEDGDKEAFLDAASATFRSLSLITMVISLENNISTTSGTYTYGAYEDLVSVLEALDLNGVLSSDEYTKGVKAAPNATQMDARVRPILATIADLIEDVANDPVNTVLDVLPKLAYALKNDIVTTQINKVLSKMSLVSIDPVDLSTGAIFDIINGKIEDFALKNEIAIDLDKDEFIATIDALAGCGTYTVKESVSRENAYRVGIDSDKTDAFMVLYRYLYKELITNGNGSIILKLVNLADNGTAVYAVKLILNLVSKRNGDLALKTVGRCLPIIRLIIKLHKIFSKISGKN
ncbi:MAG: hypothetical protein NC122_08235 [Faecalibacterium sp.]|nr:hypothetical protein [Ruminococcus sp.]MCM1392445.1 hypothetical protein [Ruminococcus sp.]MCM1486182.1 hypothetical protein [Faecalibacterium sp.]